RTIVVSATPGLDSQGRRRPVGRIGGIVRLRDDVATARLTTQLGAGAQILLDGDGGAVRIAADWDACWLRDEPIRSLHDWDRIVRAGTLPDVAGAFAVAWLGADGVLSLARDAIGERTLYYAQVSGALVFASTLHAVLATGLVSRSARLTALASYLVYAYVPGRETL